MNKNFIWKMQKGKPLEIKIKDMSIGREHFTFIAGPCTIENYDDLLEIAIHLKRMGIKFLRGGAYKMRTSPYDFQGLKEQGLSFIKEVSEKTEMITVSEVICAEDVDLMAEYIDVLQVGTRNMYNYSLLKKLGQKSNPIILKRGMSSKIEEWLLAAEYIIAEGNPNVILCERGIRTFEDYTRYTLDISAIQAVKNLSNLPIIIDPSHSSGRRDMIESLSLAAVAAGADGLLIETHFAPDSTICDSKQTIDFDLLKNIIIRTKEIRKSLFQDETDE